MASIALSRTPAAQTARWQDGGDGSLRADVPEADRILARYLRTADAAEEHRLLENLAQELLTVVSRMLTVRLGRNHRALDQIDDLRQDCLLAVLTKVDRLKRNPQEPAVDSIAAYAAVTARNAFRGELRRQNPERARLRQRILDSLKARPAELTTWSYNGVVLCGLAEWAGSPVRRTSLTDSRWLDLAAFRRECLNNRSGAEFALEHDLVKLFRWMETPVEVNRLVNWLAQLMQVQDASLAERGSTSRDDGDAANALEQVSDDSENVEDRAIDRVHREQLLHQAWQEIIQLPVRQRQALLLSLPVDAFLTYRLLVGRAALSECLELTSQEIDGLTGRLPLSDLEIAGWMGIKRQQVINLRLSARQRLGRKLKGAQP